MNLPEFLTMWPENEIVLTGHRIGVFSIIDRFQRGYSAEEIHAEFPTLEPKLIKMILDFHASHESEVEAYVAEYRAQLDRQEADFQPGLAVLKVRSLIAENTANTKSRAGS
jgi:uncharacterized protein (DUF433 family)